MSRRVDEKRIKDSEEQKFVKGVKKEYDDIISLSYVRLKTNPIIHTANSHPIIFYGISN